MIITDHKPNDSIFEKPINKINSSRLERIGLKLLKYQVKIQYLLGQFLYIADYLWRATDVEAISSFDEKLNEMVHLVE